MVLEGYGAIFAAGLWVTCKVAALALLGAFAFGLTGAVAKLSPYRLAVWGATLYTTLVRGIPPLVLMLLVYFSVQIGLNDMTEKIGLHQIDIDPLSAAVCTLGFIFGAYFTETFRGAFLAVPRGQMDAAYAIGMGRVHAFRRILFPQMMRMALPGLTNNWLTLLKSAGLVSLLGLNDMVQAAREAGNATGRQFFFYGMVALAFLALTTLSQVGLRSLERRYATGVREAQL